MKRLLVVTGLILMPLMTFVSCGPTPTSPGHKHTKTPTASRTPTLTATWTFSATPTGPTSTPTTTPTLSFTPTRTETPLCVSPLTFGKNFTGGSNSVFSFPYIMTVKYDLPVDGKVIRLHAHLSSVPTPGANIRMALYADNAGNPNALISESAPQAGVVGWNSLEIPDTANLAAGTYWIAICADQYVGLDYDNGASGDSRYNGGSFGLFPDPIGAGVNQNFVFSLYADYCAQPGSDTPTKTPTWSSTPTVTQTYTPTKTETPLCGSGYSFGKNFLSGNTGAFNYTYVFGTHFDLPVGGKVTNLHTYITSTNGNIRMALYDNAAGAPSTLITQSGSVAAVSGWVNLDVPDTAILPAGTYWIVLTTDNAANLSYDATGNSGDGYSGNMSYGAFPGTFPANGPTDWSFSFYADYCVGSGSPTPLPTATWSSTPTSTRTSTVTPTETSAPNCQGNYSFGDNFSSGTTQTFNGNTGYVFCSPVTLSVTGHVTKLHCFTGSPVGGNLQMALYYNSGSAPGAKIVESNGQAAVSGVNNFDVPNTISLSPGVYWIALAAFDSVNLFSTYTGSGGYWSYGGYGNFPSNGASGTAPGYTFSFYADFCVDVSSPTPQPTATWSFTPTRTATLTPTVTETPVCASPSTAGITSPQSSQQFGNGYLLCTKVTLGSTGKILRLFSYVSSGTGNMRMAFYNNLVDGSFPSGRPNTLLTQSNIQPTSIGWNTFEMPDTGTLAAGTYWIGVVHDNNIGNFFLSAGNVTDAGYQEYTGMGPLSNASGSGGNWPYPLSVYAHVCP